VKSRPFAISIRLIAFWSLFIAFDTATQLAFKAASERVEGIGFGIPFIGLALTTPALWLAILCYIGTFATWMAVLSRMNLSRAFPLTALTYVTVPLLAFAFFGEDLPVMRILGIGTIITGAVLIGWKE
jgi:drug/metabolite transporter (DMT)-like permease